MIWSGQRRRGERESERRVRGDETRGEEGAKGDAMNREQLEPE